MSESVPPTPGPPTAPHCPHPTEGGYTSSSLVLGLPFHASTFPAVCGAPGWFQAVHQLGWEIQSGAMDFGLDGGQ